MFGNLKVDFGKVNWHWCHGISVQMDEIEHLLDLPELSWLYLRESRVYEVVGFTNYQKFLAVSFTLTDDILVVEEVTLPSYGTIRTFVIRQFLEEAN